MIITYHGVGFVKAQVGDLVVAFNPIGKDSKEKTSRFGADLALISNYSPRYSGIDQVTSANKDTFVIDGPGEYEKNSMFIRGVLTSGPNDTINTAYTLNLDGIQVCHLGNIVAGGLSADAKELIGPVDVIFVPIAEEGGLTPKEAIKMALSFEPSLIVPVGYNEAAGEEAVKNFLKEAGSDKAEITEKLTIKKKDLVGKDGEVVVITSF